MITIHCRLADLLDEKQVTTEELAITSGISREKIDGYSKGEVDSISFHEIGIILSVLGCSSVSELLEEVPISDDHSIVNDSLPPMTEVEWNSSCPRAPDMKHSWYKDMTVSDTVYQEFTCWSCGQKISVIL